MERKPRKVKKKYTIMVVPHANSDIKSLSIPMWIINGLAVFGFISLLVVSYLAFSYLYLQHTIAENEELKAVNTTQAQEIRRLQKTTQETLTKLEEIIQTDKKVRELVGLKENDQEEKTVSRGQGGPGTSGSVVRTLGIRDLEFAQIPVSTDLELDPEPDLNTIAEIKLSMEEINRLIDEQEKVLAKLEVDVKNRLDYLAAIPSGWPVRGRITDSFGWRRNPFNKKSWEFHEGIDIAASYGTAVRAAGAGKVIFVGWKPAYGNTVVIKHDYGYVSQYAHNSSLKVKVGQVVERGDIIARVGSTGRSTGPHVDFRISFNGRWIDPLKMLNN